MLDLPAIGTRYGDLTPTYDISQFLTNGMEPKVPGSVTATVEANHVSWECRIVTARILDPSNRQFFADLPLELLPALPVSRLALHGVGVAQVNWNVNFRTMQIYGVNLNVGELSFDARTLRRAS